MSTSCVRLGVSAALVAGEWIPGDIAVSEGVVEAVGLAPSVGSRVVVSGFVDHQINGFAGVDFRRTDSTGYERVAEALVETGVTAFQPTLHSCSLEGYQSALELLAEVRRRPPPGALVLGAHLEGPFLSTDWAGAHDADNFLPPERAIADLLVDTGPVAMMTLAPELVGAIELIQHLTAQGIRVAIGHTDATAVQCHAAFDAGVSMITHCFNAHRRFGSRDPGPAGAALTDDRVSIGLIADGIHLADETLKLVANAARGRLMLVTDAVAAAGCRAPDAGSARLADGTLAGGLSPMDECVRRMIGLGVPAHEVLSAAGGNRIRPGHRMDLVVLDDRWEVCESIIES